MCHLVISSLSFWLNITKHNTKNILLVSIYVIIRQNSWTGIIRLLCYATDTGVDLVERGAGLGGSLPPFHSTKIGSECWLITVQKVQKLWRNWNSHWHTCAVSINFYYSSLWSNLSHTHIMQCDLTITTMIFECQTKLEKATSNTNSTKTVVLSFYEISLIQSTNVGQNCIGTLSIRYSSICLLLNLKIFLKIRAEELHQLAPIN